eukprot:TRINITY_DN17136_c0_g1_i3.p1 TRINITY_DN17136_c0_g1~~TRINITY_DN17136_c0_g1_i3.p1  ORF type:complete len:200 (-),score=18.68 TRINITY_DN17136_c0_g1_i3:67-582(-)
MADGGLDNTVERRTEEGGADARLTQGGATGRSGGASCSRSTGALRVNSESHSSDTTPFRNSTTHVEESDAMALMMQEIEIEGSDATVNGIPETSWSKSMGFFKREKSSARTSFNMGPSKPHVMRGYIAALPVADGHAGSSKNMQRSPPRDLVRVARVLSPPPHGGASGGED